LARETLSAPFPHSSKLPETPGPQSGGGAATERRRQGRGRIARAATVVIDETNAALVVNLGQGGMRVQALGRPVMPGARLRLQFKLPGTPEVIHVSGAVVWANDTAEAGIRFAQLPDSMAQRLREWMAINGVANAAREFMRVAGGWQAALDLTVELTRILTGARAVAITLADRPPIYSSVDDDLPIRSTVAAPIYASQRLLGHLEISSPHLGAFDEQDLSALPVLAALVGEMVELRAAGLREPARLSARILSRLEGMLPTLRVRLVP
jgi:hypothetical protein